jgi:hypothetical protein
MESSGSGKVTSHATRDSTPSRSRFWVWELLGALEYVQPLKKHNACRLNVNRGIIIMTDARESL